MAMHRCMLELLAVSQSYLVADGGAIRARRCMTTFKPVEEAFNGT